MSIKQGVIVVVAEGVTSGGEPIGGTRLEVTAAYRRDDSRPWVWGVDGEGRRYSLPQDVVSLVES